MRSSLWDTVFKIRLSRHYFIVCFHLVLLFIDAKLLSAINFHIAIIFISSKVNLNITISRKFQHFLAATCKQWVKSAEGFSWESNITT